MKSYILTVHTIDERSRPFAITAGNKKEAVAAFIAKWDEVLVSYTIVSIEEENEHILAGVSLVQPAGTQHKP